MKNREQGAPAQASADADATPVNELLRRLESVKATGPSRWAARCPAHDDRSPSLSVRECGDGTVLLHCFAGCPAGDVLAAVGLDLADLFPNKSLGRGPMRQGERWIPRDVLAAIASEAVVVLVAADTIRRGEALTDDDVERVAVAAARLRNAAREGGANV
ncbi:hypothetical protein QWY84_11915 [Aquisalimonas lutea]|uniref:hypothetical protein n=1 Tax=Aquisalimonas lutea TaxID=1327750 RepID=UPI0025B4B8B5|nr:hypothetical protein [Aquisalimonas lutea]MDN3518320.1 hypothetical protein [Aquisalimonas lutea]